MMVAAGASAAIVQKPAVSSSDGDFPIKRREYRTPLLFKD
jgi:hypothetical protein